MQGSETLNGKLVSLVRELVDHGIPLRQALRELERQYLTMLLERHGGNLTHTARTLGIHRNTLANRMRSLGVHPRH